MKKADYQNHIVRYHSYDNRISFPHKITGLALPHFAAALNEWWKRRRYDTLKLDFSGVQRPYSDGMVGIIATISSLKLKGYKFIVRLPNDQKTRDLFVRTNWAFLLDPNLAKVQQGYGRHLHTRQFRDDNEVAEITREFMDIALKTIVIPRNVVAALEWSIYEICDNVINHARSDVGGFVEAVTYTKDPKVTFTVADAGQGILKSLKEGLPHLQTNVEAIGEAIKAGVTRNKEFGQGNGLAGSLRITTMTGGSLGIVSGSGRFYDNSHKVSTVEEPFTSHHFKGTSVSGQILFDKKFQIGKALEFNGIEYVPSDIIEMEYELEGEDSFYLNLSRETTSVGTRAAGQPLRNKALNLIYSMPTYKLIIDWEGIPVISSSFADEFIGKLYREVGKERFIADIRNINIQPLVRQLLDKAISQRMSQ